MNSLLQRVIARRARKRAAAIARAHDGTPVRRIVDSPFWRHDKDVYATDLGDVTVQVSWTTFGTPGGLPRLLGNVLPVDADPDDEHSFVTFEPGYGPDAPEALPSALTRARTLP